MDEPTTEGQERAYTIGRLVAALEHSGAWRKGQDLGPLMDQVRHNAARALALPLGVIARSGSEATIDVIAAYTTDIDPAAFDRQMTLPEYGSFHLGYWQEHGRLRGHDAASPAPMVMYQVRVPLDLRDWINAHGGSEMARRVLAEARARQGE